VFHLDVKFLILIGIIPSP